MDLAATDTKTTSPEPPTFPVTHPSLEGETYFSFQGSDALLVATARDSGITINRNLNCTQSTLLIYSEVVNITSDAIQIPGLKLGIFCNKLNLGLETLTIDVSGNNGPDGIAKGDKTGSAGQDGGSIWLYVEEPSPGLAKKLTLKAYGGDGGQGLSETVATGQGGNGGNGGLSGSIHCYMGCALLRHLRFLYKTSHGASWTDWIVTVQATLQSDVDMMLAYAVDKSIIDEWQSVVGQFADLANALKRLQTSTSKMLTGDPLNPMRPKPSAQTVRSGKDLLEKLSKLADSTASPLSLKGDEAATFTMWSDLCDTFSGGLKVEQKLQEHFAVGIAIVDRMLPNGNQETSAPLDAALEKLVDDLTSASKHFGRDFAETVSRTGGGKGGRGGDSGSPNLPSGKRGQDQPATIPIAKVFGFDGAKGDVDVDQACVIPEQCEMVLEKADAAYFTNDPNYFQTAAVLYTRLIRRLRFLDNLTGDVQKLRLVQAYQALEHQGLTTESIAQLSRIYKTAKDRMCKLSLGQDMFCHKPAWVPRLSLSYYEKRIKKLLEDYEKVEKAYQEYAKAQQKEVALKSHIETAQGGNNITRSAVQYQMDEIINKELPTIAKVIAQSGSKLTDARKKLEDALVKLKHYIENTFLLSAQTILDAFSTLSMAPHGFTGIVQGLEVAYKSWTTIENLQGIAVKKDYIIDKLESCAGTIGSLTESFKRLKSGELEVQDPGYGKIMAEESKIEEILHDFKKAIPGDMIAGVEEPLNNFKTMVQQRNSAVLDYNAKVQFLLELHNMLSACDEESRRLGDAALNLNPELPAIYFWLKRLKSRMQLEILQRLNYEARALAFWGPMDIKEIRFDAPSPAGGSIDLRRHQSSLDNAFEICYGEFQNGPWEYWPISRDLTEAGIVLDMSNMIEALCKPRLTPKNTEVYTAAFSINPIKASKFLTMANVRLTQVRVWLLGATVEPDNQGQHRLRVDIDHTGYETIWDESGKPFKFEHDPVPLQFEYDTRLFNETGQVSGSPKLVYSRQAIEKDYNGGKKPEPSDRPPIGPFTDWVTTVRSDVNPGLKMNVTKVLVELCGRHLPTTGLQTIRIL
ncbi:hypothetical protein ColTof4_14472 [Colletotrichum tofieldiae]|nr:hypothetical protein ColTof4_14472 [Colletotrichum tofieldiae]